MGGCLRKAYKAFLKAVLGSNIPPSFTNLHADEGRIALMQIHSSFYIRDRPQYSSQKTNISTQVLYFFPSLAVHTRLSADSSLIINGISK